MKPFVVPVTAILRTRNERRISIDEPIADLFVSASAVPTGAPVHVELNLEPVGTSVEAIGTVTAPWEGECRRCLKPAAGLAVAEVREVFEERPVEGESYLLDHGEIDLEPLAREAIVLELPQAPLCREDCLGLCPTCGVDRNESRCDCAPPTDPRWAALDQLREMPT